jgi:hypothetical protein
MQEQGNRGYEQHEGSDEGEGRQGQGRPFVIPLPEKEIWEDERLSFFLLIT